MAYSIHNAAGEIVAGDPALDDAVKGAAILARGYVTDGDGKVVYESHAYIEDRKAAEAFEAAQAASEAEAEPGDE